MVSASSGPMSMWPLGEGAYVQKSDVSRCCTTSIILRWDHGVDHQTDADPLIWLIRLRATFVLAGY